MVRGVLNPVYLFSDKTNRDGLKRRTDRCFNETDINKVPNTTQLHCFFCCCAPKTSALKKACRWLSRSLSDDAHLGGERKIGNNYSASFIRTERNNGGQPRKTWSYSDLQMETILPSLLLQVERRGHQKPNRAKTEQQRKIKKRRMGGREGKNIHKNPVVYEEEETVQRGTPFSVCGVSSSSQISVHRRGRTEETEILISCFPVQWRHGNWNFQNLSNCARPRVAVSHWLTLPERNCADPVP
ncbi:hypothetical protein CDAR_477531 [Caerostris darwini]|uniref:Uncharacterized protein n=1 Tax=Caerostris darwini TaxID=1538125 RepID=A0AAV4RPX5_9ARAC|nr:hypothetical protein CDAR_477531 [Caerostris darwini]